MRIIDADKLKIPSEEMVAKMAIAHAPSIDIVFCKECKNIQARHTIIEGEKYCGKLCAWVKDSDFCSYGVRLE